ncbi:16S rRNA (cytosine(967)-C(5))-methyltransferase RsmB [Schnuerera sp. xch1]|uniref:16S rRNA (cytosine(967)-C(5))-methyltransferase RsmB n=1 Tax=Schnuerera sp. xch1 TaxID=2874283 RepID=UPI001CBF2CDE|nr:16S rRNA (cytosine(967)-C(5))-methyltransferase RsmB [Schnuerera sp. xch1]MBZ2173927.1 16S rRNA (cytosine(967)-C(5))-methyltransferase RsmB [Schnuerera sp. xch1]
MNSRDIALNVLIDINSKGAFSNYSINKHINGKVNLKDENLIREIVYGVIENRLYLDYIISKLSKRKLEKIHNITLDILRIGVYQMAFMDRIPDRAAVNESVNLGKRYGHRGISGFVNGILRNFSRNKEKLMKVDEQNELDYLSIKYSHPKWMVKRWIKDYGSDFTEKLLIANNSTPKLNIRVNTIKTSRHDLADILSNYGYTVFNTKYAKDGLIIENPTKITQLEEFKLGYFIIQDESSMLVSQITNPKENSIVLDLCSAPGGKSTHLAQQMNNNGRIISRDIYEHKLNLVENNASRLGIDIIETQKYDALELDMDMLEKVDYCIVDAPCSGLGIIRRRPEIKWNRRETDIKNLTRIQSNILNNTKKYVKPGGFIIYSTCTLGKEENICIVKEFLEENKEFNLVGFDDLICSNKKLESTKDGYIQLFPNIHYTDGFFIAKIQKNNR